MTTLPCFKSLVQTLELQDILITLKFTFSESVLIYSWMAFVEVKQADMNSLLYLDLAPIDSGSQMGKLPAIWSEVTA